MKRHQQCPSLRSKSSAHKPTLRMDNILPRDDSFGEIPEANDQLPFQPLLWTHFDINEASNARMDTDLVKETNFFNATSRKSTKLRKNVIKAVIANRISNSNCVVTSTLSPKSAKVDQWLEATSDYLESGRSELSPVNGHIHVKSIGPAIVESFRNCDSRIEAQTSASFGHYSETLLHNNKVRSESSSDSQSQIYSPSDDVSQGNSSSSETALPASLSSTKGSSVEGTNYYHVPINEDFKSDFGGIPANEQSSIGSEMFSCFGHAERTKFSYTASVEKFHSREVINFSPPPEPRKRNPMDGFNHLSPLNEKPMSISEQEKPIVTEVCDALASESHNRSPVRCTADDLATASSGLRTRLELNVRREKCPAETRAAIKSSNLFSTQLSNSKEMKVSEGCHGEARALSEAWSSKETSMQLDRPYRVYLWGGLLLPTVDIVVNKSIMSKSLNRSILEVLEKTDSVSLASRLQAYMWPVVSRGQNVIAVGARSSGKTMGFILPLASLLLDMWPCVQLEANVRLGSVAIIVCKGWKAVQNVGSELSQLLAPHHIRVVTAVGGLGSDSLNEIQKEVYRGCDVLVSTLPFLMRLFGIHPEENTETKLEFDLLSYCFHLVFDDADVLLDTRAEDVKVLLRKWAVSRSKSPTTHFCQQLIVTASSWTKYICELAEFLFPLMEPTLMISSHLEAAKAVGVRCIVNVTHCFGNSPQQRVLGDVTNLVKDGAGEKKIIIFVQHYSDARQLKKLLESCAIFSRLAHGRLLTWQLQEEVKTWRSSNAAKILIVSDSVVPLLLQQDIRDAFTIVHTYVPNTKSEFVQRFSFLLDNYGEPFKPRCNSEWDPPVSFVMLDDTSSRLPPYLLECLEYLNTDIPSEVKAKFTELEKRDVPLCHYLKAHGSCPSVNLCAWRHEIVEEDLRCKLPDSGIVTLNVVKVLNASRYLVRLNQYRKKVNDFPVDLSGNYLTLFMTLQSFCSDESRLKKFVKPARVNDLCLVNYDSVWARARVLKHRQRPNMKVSLFLIDEGVELLMNTSELYELPHEFSALPQLILEVYLCKVKPVDDDVDWTQNANMFVETIFSEVKNDSQFTGTIAMSLSHTLWLSPLVEVVKVEGSLIRKESIRSQLIRHEFGAANTKHLELLERHLQVLGAQRNCPSVSWLDHWTPNGDGESSEE